MIGFETRIRVLEESRPVKIKISKSIITILKKKNPRFSAQVAVKLIISLHSLAKSFNIGLLQSFHMRFYDKIFKNHDVIFSSLIDMDSRI